MKTSHITLLGCVGSLLLIAGCSNRATESGTATTEGAVDEDNGVQLPADYQGRTAQAKQELLWSKRIVPSAYTSLPEWPSVGIFGIARLDLSVTLNRTSDELPEGRSKLVHALGTCAKVEIVADAASPYTGMFKGGVGIARFSLAAPPGTDSFTPAVAIKMFIDGMPSQNLQVMFSVDGQGEDFDFFANRFSNILPLPSGFGPNLIGAIFKQATPFPNHVDLENFARHENSGALASRLHAPHQVFFIATSEAKAVQRSSSSDVDFREDLAKIPANTTIYDIVGSDSEAGPLVHVGKLVTRSAIVAASYGDEKLFFKHEEAGTEF